MSDNLYKEFSLYTNDIANSYYEICVKVTIDFIYICQSSNRVCMSHCKEIVIRTMIGQLAFDYLAYSLFI